MGRKSAAKRRNEWWVDGGRKTEALQKFERRHHWHGTMRKQAVRGAVVELHEVKAMVMVDGKAQLETVKRPLLHHMQQYQLFLQCHAQAVYAPSSHLRHRLIISERGQVKGFRVIKGAMNRKADKCFPRGKAYKRVAAIERGTVAGTVGGVH